METSQTIEKTMLLLQTLAEKEECTAAAVTRALEVHRSTTYRMLKSLVQLGYVDHREETGLYRLSSKMTDLIHPGASFSWLKEIVDPYLDEFHRQVNETLHLAVLHKDELCYLNKWETSRSLRVVIHSRTGGHAPLHCTGLGKMLLAGQEQSYLDEVIPKLKFESFTKNTITDSLRFIRELKEIRERGVSFDNEEHEDGVCCIAVPLLDNSKKVIAAVSITVPQVRFTEERKAEFLCEIRDIARKISDEIRMTAG